MSVKTKAMFNKSKALSDKTVALLWLFLNNIWNFAHLFVTLQQKDNQFKQKNYVRKVYQKGNS